MDRVSYIIGKSVHSQRVERQKHNIFYALTGLCYKNVQYLEEIMKLWVNEVHIGPLQYTFVPRANRALNFFADSWNAHPLFSDKNQFSEQLWILWINIQKGELCTYKVSFILIPQVKCFHTVSIFTFNMRIYDYLKHFYSKHRSMWWHHKILVFRLAV